MTQEDRTTDAAVIDAGPGSASDGGEGKGRGAGSRPRRAAAARGRDAGAHGGRVPLGRRAKAALAGGEEGEPPIRRRMLMRVYRLLTRTPDDGSGLVPGTPFTKAGVADLMGRLNERASNQGAPGAKVAANAIGFLKPGEGDEDSVAGASVAKLQAVARMASRAGAPG